jgi:hypothetical protein
LLSIELIESACDNAGTTTSEQALTSASAISLIGRIFSFQRLRG